MGIVAIGDIGVVDGMVHIGDEAMFETMVAAMRHRGIGEVVGISANPTESAARYGIRAIAPVGFGRDRAANARRMSAVLSTTDGGARLPADDPAAEVIAAIAASDGVVVAGGGNMASTWPQHIIERATLGAIAARLGKPFVVTGQTIGPDLDAPDATLLADALRSAALVGLREPASFRLCSAIGVPEQLLTATIDDASYLVDEPRSPEPSRYCLVSLSTHVGGADRERMQAQIAAMLDHVAAARELEIVFLPHFACLDPTRSRGDSVMHDAVISLMRSDARIVTPTNSPAAARAARNAALVVTSRYHPAVFAVPAGVPTLAVPVDEYTTVKLVGALGNFGQDGILPVGELLAGSGPAVADRLWAGRDAIRGRADAASGASRAASAAWWDRVAAAVRP